ncbi:porin family protein [Runella salmonicolor]|uniref:PorT family protein n=1 Tax=Runella salmonicolor TaxID=2950278 RepID=A0ABT1FQ19_9BACT|nr:porin family protein [Runella salmonicolor]MCP1382698.1 PorT family protein [Runella salmonicolor]
MKKTTLIFALLSWSWYYSYAQTSPLPVKFIVHAGLNIAKLKYMGGVTNTIPTLSLGIEVSKELSKSVFFTSGIQYNGKGGRINFGGLEYNKLVFNYINIPFNIGYKVFIRENLNLTLAGGVFGGMAIGGRYNRLFDGDFTSGKIFSETDSPRRTDFGFNIGVGIEFNNKIMLSINQSPGIINLSQDPTDPLHTRCSTIRLGYVIN